MTETLHELKRRQLATRLAQLSQEYSAAWAQLGQTLGASDELRIRRSIDELEMKIREAETQLKQMETDRGSDTAEPQARRLASRNKAESPGRDARSAGGLSFRNFDLRIRQSGSGDYSVEANSELAGQAEAAVPASLFQQIADMGEVTSFESLDKARAVGSLLFDAAFPPLVRERLALAHGRLLGGEGLRIRLQLDQPTIAALPWELMYNPDPVEPTFVTLSAVLSMMRFLPTSKRAQPVPKPPPLRIVLACAQPTDFPALGLAVEAELIREALASVPELVRVEVIEHLSLDTLTDRLNDDFEILHFTGHGHFDSTSQVGGIFVEDDNRRASFIETEVLAQLLDGSSVQLVFLNTGESARTSVVGGARGLAQALVSAGVPTVIGWGGELTDKSAVRFAAEFYRCLARTLPLDTCMLNGRRALYAQSRYRRNTLTSNSFEWAMAQLVTRAAGLDLFREY